jgi:ubiquinone/menaquinone biosynthesis C-methylase UbiE
LKWQNILKNKQKIITKTAKITQGAVQKIPMPNNFFDLVTVVETYYFWNDFQAGTQEIKRVLKPNGILLIISEMLKTGIYEIKYEKIIAPTGVRLIPLEEIRKALFRGWFCKCPS